MKYLAQLLLLFFAFISTNSAYSDHPALLLTQAQLEQSKTRFTNQDSPYFTSCNSVINRASSSIMLFSMDNPVQDIKFGWCTERSGGGDGIDNSLADFYLAVNNDFTTASANAYTWALTGNSAAAQKAISVFQDWENQGTIIDMYDFNIDFHNATFDGMTSDGYCGQRPWNFALDMGWTAYGLRAAANAYIILKENGFPLSSQEIQDIESVIRKLADTTDSSLDAWGEWARLHPNSGSYNRYISDNHIAEYLSALAAAAAALGDVDLFNYIVNGGAYDFGNGNNNANYANLKRYLDEALVIEPDTSRVVYEDYYWKDSYRAYHGAVQIALGVLFRILDLYYPSAKNMYEGYINLSGYTAMDAAQTYAGYILGQYGGGSGDSLSNHFSHQIGLEYAFAETENAHRKNTFWDALHTSIAAQTPRTQDFKEFTSTVCFIGEERDSDPPVPGVRELTISSATASSNDGNIPENTIDNNLDTRWSAEGDGEWIEFDLGAEYIISELRIAFFRGDERTTTFDSQTSTNQDQ